MTRTRAVDERENRERYAHSLAIATVRRYRECPTGDWDDLYSAALEGAALALARFDAGRGTKFSSFAITHIRGCVLTELRFWDHLSRGTRQAVRAGAPEPLPPVSLDAPMPGGEEGGGFGREAVADAVDAEEVALTRLESARWRKLLAKLPPRERRVIYARFWDGATHEELARTMGISSSRVDQLAQQALGRLRMWAEAYGLAPEDGSGAETTQEARRGKTAQQQAPVAGRATEAITR